MRVVLSKNTNAVLDTPFVLQNIIIHSPSGDREIKQLAETQ
ncbi:MAG: hypothetical protein RL616_580 [Verrucomicrobiota bacterium]